MLFHIILLPFTFELTSTSSSLTFSSLITPFHQKDQIIKPKEPLATQLAILQHDRCNLKKQFFMDYLSRFAGTYDH